MFALIVRLIKRGAVLMPGLVVAYIAVRDIYPALDRAVPRVVAILITYVLVAYVLIPALLRLINFILRPTHIPLYSTTPDGFACDPINVGVIGTRTQMVRAMKSAGWYQADKRTPRTLFKMIVATLTRRPYPTAPFSTLYLFGRGQDIGFELPIDNQPDERHHVRFWACHMEGPEAFHEHVRFWQRFAWQRAQGPARQLWVGCVSRDVGIGIIRHNAQMTHMIDPDTNSERDLLVANLKATKHVKSTRKIRVGKPYRLRNRVFRGHMHADGMLTICELRQ